MLRRPKADKGGAMKSIQRNLPGMLAAAGLACMGQAQAQVAPPDPPIQVVQVEGLRDPDEHAYRRMVEGMDAFEKYHHLAPDALLRYRLIPRLPGVKVEGTRLTIRGDKVRLPVALASDLSFTLPRDAAAWDERAQVTANRQARSFMWQPYVRTPGLPENTRRLGDLRLECEIDRAAKLLVILKLPAYVLLAATVDVCTSYPGAWQYYAERAVFNVTLVHGKRREAMLSRSMYAGQPNVLHRAFDFYPILYDRLYILKINDTSWPDDTLVELEYMDDSAGAQAVQTMETP
jgi:hypothetical protein